ncbi:hypothetical protein C7212DRAFT_310288 [Tuber magnatum]|uniref:Uncharacterized protein n=1 Tax=Tuber magnatum TaxID=42249 RepID=A0A317SYH3_9PEZI|nr:hypothetical protein C7212DRAFT_310288 [Tuber magnatum]
MFTGYNKRGRLVLDIKSHEESRSDAFRIVIHYKPNTLFGLWVYLKTSREMFGGWWVGRITLPWTGAWDVDMGQSNFGSFVEIAVFSQSSHSVAREDPIL